MSVPAGPKGTRDFFPDDMALQRFIFSAWEKTCGKYGFEPYEGPMFEHLELYTRKSGDEIEAQLYAFKDKKGRDLALRPEMTPTLARMVASRGTDLKLPARWYSIPRLFRYEKMQRGRLREFFQLNMDIIGIQEESAEAELIASSIDMMRSLGFDAGDFKIRIASRTLLEELFNASGLSLHRCAEIYPLLDRKNSLQPGEFRNELARAVPEKDVFGKIESIIETRTLEDVQGLKINAPALQTLRSLMEIIDMYGMSDFVTFDIGIVRGLAYYTGTVFEIYDIAGSMRAIAGGGRYDNLIEQYGGSRTPAAGFAAGDVVLADLMREKGLVPPPPGRSFCYIVAINGTDRSKIIAAAQELRREGISCEFSLKNASLGRQMRNANAARSPYVLFIGGEETSRDMVKIKDMGTGQENLVPRGSMTESIMTMQSKGT